jgi:hypothetical protein
VANSVINFPGAAGGTSVVTIIIAIIAIIVIVYFIKKNLSNLMGGKLGAAIGGDTATEWDIYQAATSVQLLHQLG